MPIPAEWVVPLVFVLGCVVGSFLNVCIYRLPRDRSVVAPPSHCPQCGARLGPLELAPLLSFLLLGRKCRHCGGMISWRYFTVELLTGLLFVLVWRAYPFAWPVLPAWIFASVMLAVIFTDLDHMIIPDQLVLVGLAAAAAWAGAPARPEEAVPAWAPLPGGVAGRLLWAGLGGLLGVALFVLMRGFSQLLFRKEGMGLGDVKLAGAIGAMLGPTLALLSFGMAVVVGAALGLGLLVLRLRRRMEYLPFGPFMAVAALLVLLYPTAITGAARAAWIWYASKVPGLGVS